MNSPSPVTKGGIVKTAVFLCLAALGHSRLITSDASQAAGVMIHPHALEKRDAYTCYSVCHQLSRHAASYAQDS
ncbi:hypothetical protein F5Y14DRAFT_409190 [Nemania sp. NC0429]|nr:hypothetical protein F5Y14DRAFT_409190 [Nemania sp. NC0429]